MFDCGIVAAIVAAAASLPVMAIVLGMGRIKRAQRSRRQDGLPHCRQCEYLLIGNQSGRCPECGTLLSPENVLYGERGRRTRFDVIGVALVVLGLLVPTIMLAAIIVPKFTGRAIYPKTAAASADVSNLKVALDAFDIDFGRFPTPAEGLNILVNPPNGGHGYVAKVPVDPWGTPYIYRVPGKNGQDFDLFSCGPDGIPDTADDVGR